MQKHRTWVEINSHALSNNIQSLKNLLRPEATFCAVLKANAYGHGLMETASIVQRNDVTVFAVDHIDDALILREAYPNSTIIVLGYTMFDRFKDAINKQIQITLYDKEGIDHADKTSKELVKPISVHIKIETGTARQGVMREDWVDILRHMKRSPHIKVTGISTHFANIEEAGSSEYASHQFSLFQEASNLFSEHGIYPEWQHCACSAAMILYPETHLSLVRAGISLYGMWSSEHVQNTVRRQGFHCNLEPVLTWKTRIAQIKSLPMGAPIGYGLTEHMKKSGRIAVLPVGYWDGYDRLLSSVGEVLIKGVRCKVMGRVCMNMIMVDVSQVPQPEKEDQVTLLGVDGHHKILAEDIAKKQNTIPYEVVTRINPTLPRVIV